ncbi:MFS transporter [Gorillibacterium sp. sgz5001074]|uniref:MFS transporter n=1 Tax=Gorillibacterium sp. sgz5001074 TaxID=3446695 RepID=UPI003F678DDF
MKNKLSVIVLLLLTVFVGFGIIIPVLPVMVEHTGSANTHMGLLLTLYSAASFIMSPLWGSWSDRIGRRPVILIGLSGFALSFFLFGLADERLWLMYVSRFIGGLFSGAVTSCAVAYVADITTEENRTKGMGMVGMAIGLGFVIGPGVGGLLSIFGNSVPFFASAGLSLLALLVAYRVLDESLTPDKRALQAAGKKQSRWTAFSGVSKYLYVLSFLVSFTLAGLETVFQLYEMERMNLSVLGASGMFFANGIVGAAIQGGVVRKRIKKGGEGKAILLGLLLSSAGFFLLLLPGNWLMTTLYLCVFGAGNALIRPCVTSLITQKTTVSQGLATGLMSSMDSLGRILGPLLMGSVLYSYSIFGPFAFGGAVCLAAILLLARFTITTRTSEKAANLA